MNDITFVDTTLRDGDQSLWGSRLTTGMLLPVASEMDRMGFDAIDVDGMTFWKWRVRQYREEPWDRIKLLSKKFVRTPMTIMCGASTGQFYVGPLAFAKLRVERLAANGIKRVQVTGFLNDMRFRVPEVVQFARDAGLQIVIGLNYTISPRHTDDYYAEKARQAAALRPDRIYIKDAGGLLTPERTKTLVPAIKQNIGALPFELHSHCTTGLAPICYLEAIKLGVTILHTGISPLANGSAQPSLASVARNARLLGFNPVIDEAPLQTVSDHFRFIALRNGWPPGVPLEYDYEQYLHQVPGGVISSLKRQLVEMKMPHLLKPVLEETAKVHEEMGYPIMVTPFSQHVVTQASINVMLHERYKEVPDELIQYCLGYWGEEASCAVDAGVKAKVLDRPRARELARQERYEPSIEEIRRENGGASVSDDELIARYAMGGDDELKAMRPAPPIREYHSARSPLMALIQELLQQKGSRYIDVKKGNVSLTLRRIA